MMERRRRKEVQEQVQEVLAMEEEVSIETPAFD